MTFDGQYAFAYDAWNRLAAVKRAYRDGSGTLTLTSTVGTISYDGLDRRICKDISNSADWDYTYNYYHNGQSCVEERNGSGKVIRQYVWGLTYIDELLQVGLNQDPADANEQFCERFFWACQDANFNVLGLTRSCTAPSVAKLVERYEYTPYGQRTIFSRPWFAEDMNDDDQVDMADYQIWFANFGQTDTWGCRADLDGNGVIDMADDRLRFIASGQCLHFANDPNVMMPALDSTHGYALYSPLAPTTFGLCEFGHQGLRHDKEWGGLDNRDRITLPVTARFPQRDDHGYVDGSSLYQNRRTNPLRVVDPKGRWGEDVHVDLTYRLALLAGFGDLANTISAWDQLVDKQTPGVPFAGDPPYVGKAAAWGLITHEIDYETAISWIKSVSYWHFPGATEVGGKVEHGSGYAWCEARIGIGNCNLMTFSQGLHSLQDSFSHRDVPGTFFNLSNGGIGWFLARGIIPPSLAPGGIAVNPWGGLIGHSDETGGWLSSDADDVKKNPQWARKAGIATYKALLDFRHNCQCLEEGWKAGTTIKYGTETNPDEVFEYLWDIFPNKPE